MLASGNQLPRVTARLAVPLMLALLALSSVGCTGKTVSVPADSAEVTLDTGNTLEVEFGYVNPSVGHKWRLVGAPDGDVLRDLGDQLDGQGGGQGTGGDLTWRFEATATGRTTLRLQYCNLNGQPACDGSGEPLPKPVRLAVTVR